MISILSPSHVLFLFRFHVRRIDRLLDDWFDGRPLTARRRGVFFVEPFPATNTNLPMVSTSCRLLDGIGRLGCHIYYYHVTAIPPDCLGVRRQWHLWSDPGLYVFSTSVTRGIGGISGAQGHLLVVARKHWILCDGSHLEGSGLDGFLLTIIIRWLDDRLVGSGGNCRCVWSDLGAYDFTPFGTSTSHGKKKGSVDMFFID